MREPDPNTELSRLDTLTQSTRRRAVAMQLALFFGLLGVHRWYLGKPGSALLQAISCGGIGIWWLYDLYRLGFSQVLDGDDKPLGPPVFRNLERENQRRIASEIVADQSRADLEHFDEKLSASLDENPDRSQQEVDIIESHKKVESGEKNDQEIH